MSAEQARAVSSVPTGNTYDKYGSTNPLVRRLMAGFEGTLGGLFERAAPESLLDVGCGEGVLTEQWAQRLGDRRVVGLDLPDPKLEGHWRTRQRANLHFLAGRAEELPFADKEFDLVAAIETLEHVADPDRTLAEMARVARRHLLVSVPREPLWRALNLLRGAYVPELGNTPGHLNHWSKRGFEELLARHGEVIEARSPFPWTMVLTRVR
jgi:2-polyprenyl-3-methyl-5-hydroxy-6-metoxy-1,4-benzoquinol methylase